MSCIEDFEIHDGDEGTPFTLTIRDRQTNAVVDISAATLIQLEFDRPDPYGGLIVSASLVSGGTTGKARYIWQEGDLVPGVWKVQAYVETTTQKFHSSIGRFVVKKNVFSRLARTANDVISMLDNVLAVVT